MSGLPTAMPLKLGTEMNASCALPICCATPNTTSTSETPASLRAFTSCCSALLPLVAAAPISRAGPCEGRGHHPRPIPRRPQPSLGQALDRKLDRLLAITPTAEAGGKLARGIRKCRGDLFVFITRRDVPATNNDCERALRPSVIFRKVTGGFRSQWGARAYADALSVIATGRLHGRSALHALGDALAGRPVLIPP